MILDTVFSYTNGLHADALGDVKPDYEDLRRTMKHVKPTPDYLLRPSALRVVSSAWTAKIKIDRSAPMVTRDS